MKRTGRLLSLLMVLCMLLSSCAQVANGVANTAPQNQIAHAGAAIPSGNGGAAENLSAGNRNDATPEKGTYNEGVVLVKYNGEMNDTVLSQLSVKSAEALFAGSAWYSLALNEGEDTVEAVRYFRALGCFDEVDYDYVMKADGEVQSVDISSNTYADQLTYLETMGVKKGWESNLNNGKTPGGSPDVIIAIIDTGVDYNHLDLRNNIWVNSAEIPDNGIDDDGNGYVDDIHGWDCVGDDNDPMDDNGHGTHVAGIAAAEHNKIGTVGVAYNCKIMVLKAGNSSGYFNNSDIAEAVQYAYMNGASVINMSFGGSSISRAAEEALEDAYYQCVLVAAAGNSGLCNQPGCPEHIMQPPTPFYPASLTCVIGVMSCNASGTMLSGFSNFDHYPFNNYEYDVCACGENIQSTWPNNKYASLSGTSMASPTVAGIAAVLRSTFSDREMYSTKFITAQIVSTVSRTDGYGVANLYTALTKVPAPFIYNIYDQYVFDNVEFSPKNNGNGVIDAGETIHLAIELINRGGMASNVTAKIDTIRNNDPDLTDPYFTIVKDTIHFSDIGTYSVRDCGKLYDEDGNLIGTEKYFEIVVSEDCPNSYLADFNVRITYENGLDENDKTVYEGLGSVLCNVNRGYHLSGVISEDTVFEADRLYIVSSDVVIPEGVTVTFKEGCEIQFYDNRAYFNSPRITVYGTLKFEGTKDNTVSLHPDDHHEFFACFIDCYGTLTANYLDAVNLSLSKSYMGHLGNFYISNYRSEDDVSYVSATNSSFKYNAESYGSAYSINRYDGGTVNIRIFTGIEANVLDNCYIEQRTFGLDNEILELKNCYYYAMTFNCFSVSCAYAINNIFYTETSDLPRDNNGNTEGFSFYKECSNNRFYSSNDRDYESLLPIEFKSDCVAENNSFSVGYRDYASQVIPGYVDASGRYIVDIYGSCSDISKLWPHVVSVEMFNKDGEKITTIGKEEIKVRVTFNRAMDTTLDTYMGFGTVVPYDDYRINGEWISNTVWEGTYTLKAQIENGLNYLKVGNATAAEDPTLVVFGDYMLHEFNIDTTAALSMNLQANPTDGGIELTFAQDDYDTLLGYNVYRSEEKDGNYVKLNPTILLSTDEKFLDENAEPGKTYWYTYTVVLSDFTESNPAGKVMATAKDTLAPSLYHTPVNQGYLNNNLVIACTASDNVGIASVVLYYRAVGAAEWKTLTMLRQNDKYSATVFGSELTLNGIEYYIVAYDTNHSIAKGSAETPYTVVVKDASAISRLGDVDGDGTVTTKDALMLMQAINEERILTDDEFKRADLNRDGVLSSMEALRILQYINGNVNTLEM